MDLRGQQNAGSEAFATDPLGLANQAHVLRRGNSLSLAS